MPHSILPLTSKLESFCGALKPCWPRLNPAEETFERGFVHVVILCVDHTDRLGVIMSPMRSDRIFRHLPVIKKWSFHKVFCWTAYFVFCIVNIYLFLHTLNMESNFEIELGVRIFRLFCCPSWLYCVNFQVGLMHFWPFLIHFFRLINLFQAFSVSSIFMHVQHTYSKSRKSL